LIDFLIVFYWQVSSISEKKDNGKERDKVTKHNVKTLSTKHWATRGPHNPRKMGWALICHNYDENKFINTKY